MGFRRLFSRDGKFFKRWGPKTYFLLRKQRQRFYFFSQKSLKHNTLAGNGGLVPCPPPPAPDAHGLDGTMYPDSQDFCNQLTLWHFCTAKFHSLASISNISVKASLYRKFLWLLRSGNFYNFSPKKKCFNKDFFVVVLLVRSRFPRSYKNFFYKNGKSFITLQFFGELEYLDLNYK